MKKAIFAGSFDPFTLGHKDIVMRAAQMFDEVVVALASDNGKNSRPIEKREEIISASIEGISNVKVIHFDGLLTDLMSKLEIKFLVRGVRTAADYDYERNLMSVYRSQYPETEFVLIPSKAELSHISSTVVRELVKLDGNLSGYVDTKAEKYVIDLYRE